MEKTEEDPIKKVGRQITSKRENRFKQKIVSNAKCCRKTREFEHHETELCLVECL